MQQLVDKVYITNRTGAWRVRRSVRRQAHVAGQRRGEQRVRAYETLQQVHGTQRAYGTRQAHGTQQRAHGGLPALAAMLPHGGLLAAPPLPPA